MRIYLLSLVVLFLVIYSWKDWYKSLCGLIVMMAIVERPDMPRTILGIPGLNPWNILFASILLAFLAARKREGLKWDMPRHIKIYLYIYLLVVLAAFAREFVDLDGMVSFANFMGVEPTTRQSLFFDDVINTIKYAVPGILLYIGCNSEKRLKLAYGAVLLLNILLAIQIIKWMPLSEIANGDVLKRRAIRILDREIGYYRTDLAVMLAGASWAIYAFREVLTGIMPRLIALGGSMIAVLGMVLTGGRMGMASWAVVAFLMAVFRWRKFLILAPVAIILIGLAIPSVMERLTQGFSEDTVEQRSVDLMGDISSAKGVDLYTITAGRTSIWPFVVDKIGDAPYLGHGRRAMQRLGLSEFLAATFHEAFPHPHNAYLQLLLDNGWLLSLPIFMFYLLILSYSLSLFRDRSNILYVAVGGGTFAFVLAQLSGSIGAQSFYPSEGTVSMWCMMGLMLRVYVQRKRMQIPKPAEKSVEEGQLRTLWERPAIQ
ncbi:MAG TPA: O-antigen ligase domain-containing protein [Gammaproteobacteria bacterium]|nr:O-antigen ligase domain-containing protein [Gammaproteobacteria bacterium]